MDSRDRMAIEALFAKLASVERAGQPRDAEAEAYICQRIAAQPGAPYYMAQTVIVQEQALDAAQQRIAELECMLAERAAGRRGFAGSTLSAGPWGAAPRHTGPVISPVSDGARPALTGDGHGGFLSGAAQTAMGVAGGVLLANMITGLFGRDAAQAVEPGREHTATGWNDDPSLIEPADYDDDDGFDLFDGDFEI